MLKEVTVAQPPVATIVDAAKEFLIAPEHLPRFFGKDKTYMPVFFKTEDCEDPIKIIHHGKLKILESGGESLKRKYIDFRANHRPKDVQASFFINGSRSDDFAEGLPVPLVPAKHPKAKEIIINLSELKKANISESSVSVCRKVN